MNRIARLFALLGLGMIMAAMTVTPGPAAWAEGQGVLATVNDKPVTSFDVEQRIKLLQVLGDGRSTAELRKRALQSAIDDIVKREEALKRKIEPTEEQINRQVARIAKGMGTTPEGLAGKLKAKGISMTALKNYVSAQIALSRIMGAKSETRIEADQAEVDRRYNKIKAEYNKMLNDPRLKPVTVYQLLEITLPLDAMGDANDQQMLMSRAIEAQQVMKRFTGCKSARAAAEGIFNVKVGKPFDADGSKIPKELKAILDKTGPGKAIGPVRNKTALQVIGFCGTRTVKPQKPELPPREAVENAVLNEAYEKQQDSFMAELRQKVYIEYKGASQSQ
jgi:peptidyl-prolyl cis-trans isomerase SurA